MWDVVVSVDLAQRSDFTAIVVGCPLLWCGAPQERRVGLHGLEVDPREAVALNHPAAVPGWFSPLDLPLWDVVALRDRQHDRPSAPPVAVVHLDRFNGLAYPKVVERIARLVRGFPRGLDVQLLADAGGVGVAVLDLMRAEGLRPAEILATGGDRISGVWPSVRVPKREMIASTQVALARGTLRIARALPLAQLLVDELVAYEVKLSDGGHDSYSARSGQHDDLCYAAAQMVWSFYWYFGHEFERDDARRRTPVA
jgi:hypothetical protein